MTALLLALLCCCVAEWVAVHPAIIAIVDEVLEAVGIDADHTPVDALPEHGAWAIAEDILLQQGEDPNE